MTTIPTIDRRQQVAQALARRITDPTALLSAAELRLLSDGQRAAYLAQLTDDSFWAQADIAGAASGLSAWREIQRWARYSGEEKRHEG